MFEYYILQGSHGRYDLRQMRYKHAFDQGREHPHDLMAVGFTADDMRDLCERTFAGKVDMSALPKK